MVLKPRPLQATFDYGLTKNTQKNSKIITSQDKRVSYFSTLSLVYIKTKQEEATNNGKQGLETLQRDTGTLQVFSE